MSKYSGRKFNVAVFCAAITKGTEDNFISGSDIADIMDALRTRCENEAEVFHKDGGSKVARECEERLVDCANALQPAAAVFGDLIM